MDNVDVLVVVVDAAAVAVGYVVVGEVNGGCDEQRVRIGYGRQLTSDLAGMRSVAAVACCPFPSQIASVAGLGGRDVRRIEGRTERQIRSPLGCLTSPGKDGGAYYCRLCLCLCALCGWYGSDVCLGERERRTRRGEGGRVEEGMNDLIDGDRRIGEGGKRMT